MPGAEVPGPPGPGDHVATGIAAQPHVSRARSRVQVTPHRLAVMLLVIEYRDYKVAVPVSPQDRTASCYLTWFRVQTWIWPLHAASKSSSLSSGLRLWFLFCACNTKVLCFLGLTFIVIEENLFF